MSDSEPEATVTVRPKPKKPKPRKMPMYHVVLWNDDDHTYEYVILMLRILFGHPYEQGFQLALTVDKQGKAVVLTTTLELAELKRDQIHAYGPDPLLKHCVGSMSATIEKVPE